MPFPYTTLRRFIMARFRKKALNQMSVWELSIQLDKLTNKRHALDVQITEIMGYIRDSEIAAQVHLRDAKENTGLAPYQHQHDDLLV